MNDARTLAFTSCRQETLNFEIVAGALREWALDEYETDIDSILQGLSRVKRKDDLTGGCYEHWVVTFTHDGRPYAVDVMFDTRWSNPLMQVLGFPDQIKVRRRVIDGGRYNRIR
jgi:hypothetical protein